METLSPPGGLAPMAFPFSLTPEFAAQIGIDRVPEFTPANTRGPAFHRPRLTSADEGPMIEGPRDKFWTKAMRAYTR